MPNSIRFGRPNASHYGLSRTTNLPSYTAFSIMAWVKVNNTTPISALFFHGSGINTAFVLLSWQGRLQLYNNGQVGAFNGTALTAGRWYHVALVNTGAGTNNLFAFLNGKTDSFATASTGSAGRVQIGADLLSGATDWLDGNVAALKIYNRALLEDGVAAEMPFATPVSWRDLNSCYPIPSQQDLLASRAPHRGALTRWADYSGYASEFTENASTFDTELGPPGLKWAPANSPFAYRRRVFVAPVFIGGVVAGSLSAIVGAGTAVGLPHATVAGSLAALVGAGTAATPGSRASVAGSLNALVGAGTAKTPGPRAVVAGALSPLAGVGTAKLFEKAVVAGSLAPLVGAGDALPIEQAVVAGALHAIVGAGTAIAPVSGTASGSLAAIVGTGTATVQERAILGGALSAIIGVGTAEVTGGGTFIHGSLSAIIGSGTATLKARGIVAGQLASLVGAGTASEGGARALLAGILSAIIGHGTARGPIVIVIPIERTGALEFDAVPATTLVFLDLIGARMKGPLQFKVGEVFPIRFTIDDDLTNIDTLTWTVRRLHEPPIINKRPLTRIAPYELGAVEYQPVAGEFVERGKFYAEVEARFTDGRRRRYPSPHGYAEIIVSGSLTTTVASVGGSLAAIGAP